MMPKYLLSFLLVLHTTPALPHIVIWKIQPKRWTVRDYYGSVIILVVEEGKGEGRMGETEPCGKKVGSGDDQN